MYFVADESEHKTTHIKNGAIFYPIERDRNSMHEL